MIEIQWTDNRIKAFRKQLLDWFDQSGRQLPWRQNQDPYRVWISEIMLQQTQVQTVIPYYERFLAAFPTVESLAQATDEQLLEVWQGLGYYSRVRNMRAAAQQVVDLGAWPDNSHVLLQLKGVGPYTAAAIASISFNEVIAAIDGNAFRVFARLLKIDDDITDPKNRAVFQAVGQQLIDPDRPGDFNQAIMDLGSSYMTAKNPDHENNPVAEFDQASLDGQVDDYPVKIKRVKQVKQRWLAWRLLDGDDHVYVKERPANQLLGGFMSYPLLELSATTDHEELFALAQQQLAIDFPQDQFELSLVTIEPVRHIFTHRSWEVYVVVGQTKRAHADWLTTDAYKVVPKSRLQTKLDKVLEKESKPIL